MRAQEAGSGARPLLVAFLLAALLAVVGRAAEAQPAPVPPKPPFGAPAKPAPQPPASASAAAVGSSSAAAPVAASAPAAPSEIPAAPPTVATAAPPPPVVTLPPPPVATIPLAPTTTASAAPIPSASITEAKAAEPVNAAVMLHDTNVVTLHLAYRGESAEQRAKAASKALEEAADDAKPEDVRTEPALDADGTTVEVVYVGKAPILRLTKDDAAASNAPLTEYADAVAQSLRKAIKAEKERSALASKIFSISLVVLLFVAMIFLVRKIGDLAQRANVWIEEHPERIPAIRVRSLEVVHPVTLRGGITVALSGGKWVAQIGIVYLWVIVALSMFESTRKYTSRLTGFIVEPFGAMMSRVANTLPLFLVGAIAVIAVAILLRVVQLFFESVSNGQTTVSWLPADLAKPTSILARVGIVLVGLIFAAPLITGNVEGALPRVGLVAMCAMGVAAVPLAATAILGVVVVYGRRLKLGEFIELDGREGKLAKLGFLDVTVRGDDGVETRIPHLLWLIRSTRVMGPTPRTAVRVSFARELYGPELRERLMAGLTEIGAEPQVEVVAIETASVTLALSVRASESVKARLHDFVLEATRWAKPPITPTGGSARPG
ncbi:MAG: mechanosensitive ion channel [Polyangiaceae bacterium]